MSYKKYAFYYAQRDSQVKLMFFRLELQPKTHILIVTLQVANVEVKDGPPEKFFNFGMNYFHSLAKAAPFKSFIAVQHDTTHSTDQPPKCIPLFTSIGTKSPSASSQKFFCFAQYSINLRLH